MQIAEVPLTGFYPEESKTNIASLPLPRMGWALAEQISDNPGRELALHEIEKCAGDEAPGVQGAKVGGGDVPTVGFAVGPAVARDLLPRGAVTEYVGSCERRWSRTFRMMGPTSLSINGPSRPLQRAFSTAVRDAGVATLLPEGLALNCASFDGWLALVLAVADGKASEVHDQCTRHLEAAKAFCSCP